MDIEIVSTPADKQQHLSLLSKIGYEQIVQSDEEHDSRALLKNARTWKLRFYTLLGITVCIYCVGGLFLFSNIRFNQEALEMDGPFTPANEAVSYIRKWMVGDQDTPSFLGEPREEMDEAWHNLLDGTLIRLSEDEPRLANNATSIAYEDGGYVGGLGISHSLHCLKRINQYFYKDYYYGHEEQNWNEIRDHVSHCLESLRLNAICQPDLSVYTLEWTPHSRTKPAVRVPQPHKCVDWDALHAWMRRRAAQSHKMVGPDPTIYENTDGLTHSGHN